jgi:ribosomal protein S18 acetylase RimI-like enzyme
MTMDMTTNELPLKEDIQEVRILSGIKPDHVEDVLNLAAASGLFSSDLMMSAEDMAWDSAYGDGNESHVFLRAAINTSGAEKLVGFICFGPVLNWEGNYELYGIAVAPEFQRLGIGSALVAEMTRQITAEGGKRIYLETGDDRAFEGARLFYEANDYVMEYRFLKHFIPTEGGVIYRYNIEYENIEPQYQ